MAKLLIFIMNSSIICLIGMVHCADFVWGRVNFLHSNWYGATFWICAENSVDNTGMFSLLLSSAYTVKACSVSHTTSPMSGLGVHKELGGDTAGTTDPS